MIREDEEEYKKRLERARQLRTSMGFTTDNDITNNSISTSNDAEYQEKLNRAKALRQSVGMISDYDYDYDYEDQLNPINNISDINNSFDINNIVEENRQENNVDNLQQENTELKNQELENQSNVNTNTIEENKNKTAVEAIKKMKGLTNSFSDIIEKSLPVDINSIQTDKNNQQQKNELTEEQKAEIQNKIDNFNKNNNQNIPINVEEKIQNTNIDNEMPNNLSIANKDEIKNLQKVTNSQIKAMETAEKRNEEIEKGGSHAVNAYIETIVDNAYAGLAKKPIAGLANVVTSLAGLGIKGLEGTTKAFGMNDTAENLNNAYNNVIDFGSTVKDIAEYESNVTSQIDNDFVRASGKITDVISNMLGNQVIGYAIGIPGSVAQGLSVGGNSAQEVLDEDKEKIGQATVTGFAKGYISYFTENIFDANILTKGGKVTSVQRGINKFISNRINSKIGKEIANKEVSLNNGLNKFNIEI